MSTDIIQIITVTEDYILLNQWAYTSLAKAEKKYNELLVEYYQDDINVVNENCEEELTVEDYQYSEAWWDNNIRIKVHFEQVRLHKG